MALLPTTPAPKFKTDALIDGKLTSFSLDSVKGKYFVLFFYPADFTFVCPTEIRALSDRANEFHKINCQVACISTDSVHSHLTWSQMPREKGGIAGVSIPMLADRSQEISRSYGVLMKDGMATRATFIIDGKGIIRHVDINDAAVGRSVDEIIRLVQAFQYTDVNGEVCQASWKPGTKGFAPTHEGIQQFSSQQ